MGNVQAAALTLAEQLRDNCPTLKLLSHCGGGSFKSQIKKADKSGAAVALILAEDEVAAGAVTVKFLREDRPQQTVPVEQSVQLLNEYFN